jgi:hypothetical protein
VKNGHFPSGRQEFQRPQACVARAVFASKEAIDPAFACHQIGHNAELPVHTLTQFIAWFGIGASPRLGDVCIQLVGLDVTIPAPPKRRQPLPLAWRN